MAKRHKPSAKEIEQLYDSGESRLTQERNDFLLPQIFDFVKQRRWLNIRPEYQRRLVWDRKKKSLFIESLLMNIPVPPIFLFESDLSRYEVMDGQQRLNAIIDFYDNQLVLTGLEVWSALNGYNFGRCPPKIQRGFDRRRISATVLLAESVTTTGQANDIRRQVFERLNTGGQTLNAQELRNSLYSGPFNDLINELAGLRQFNEAWDIPAYEDNYRKSEGYISPELADNKLFRRMTDCEIVLRYFSLRRISKIKGPIRDILDDCMAEYRDLPPDSISAFRRDFCECLDLACQIFGGKVFQVPGEDGKWRHSQALFDAVMVSVDRLRRNHAEKMVRAKQEIVSDLEKLFRDRDRYDIIVGKPNTATAIKQRIDLVTNLMAERM